MVEIANSLSVFYSVPMVVVTFSTPKHEVQAELSRWLHMRYPGEQCLVAGVTPCAIEIVIPVTELSEFQRRLEEFRENKDFTLEDLSVG